MCPWTQQQQNRERRSETQAVLAADVPPCPRPLSVVPVRLWRWRSRFLTSAIVFEENICCVSSEGRTSASYGDFSVTGGAGEKIHGRTGMRKKGTGWLLACCGLWYNRSSFVIDFLFCISFPLLLCFCRCSVMLSLAVSSSSRKVFFLFFFYFDHSKDVPLANYQEYTNLRFSWSLRKPRFSK